MLAGGEGAFTTRTIRSAEFAYETAIERLVGLDRTSWGRSTQTCEVVTQGEYGEGQDAGMRRMRLGTIVDTDCRLSVMTPSPLLALAYKLNRAELTCSLYRLGVPEP